MRRRAKRIDLEPEVEDACLKDLGALCSDLEHYGKGKVGRIFCLDINLVKFETLLVKVIYLIVYSVMKNRVTVKIQFLKF